MRGMVQYLLHLRYAPPGGPNITPPKVNGFHADPKMVGLALGAGIVAYIVIKTYQALPKWLLLIIVPGILVALGVAAVRLGGFQVGH